MARYLSVVERAYYGTLEEQDDTILWFSHILKNAGADLGLLLRGNAVNYAVQGQNAEGLRFGNAALRESPTIDRDVVALAEAGVPIYVVEEDLRERGVEPAELVGPVQLISQHDIAALFDRHEQVWHW